MKLRTAILLGYGFLVGLLLVTATLATVGYFDLSNRVEDFLVGNVAGIDEAIERVEQLEVSDEDARAEALEKLHTHRDELENSDGRAREAANELAIRIGIVVAIALLALVFLSRAIQRLLVERLRQMQSTVDAITTGDYRRRFAVDRRDELGNLARRFNETLDEQHEYRSRLDHWRQERSRLVRGLLDHLDRKVCVFDRDGSIIAANVGGEMQSRASSAIDDVGIAIEDSMERQVGTLVFIDDL